MHTRCRALIACLALSGAAFFGQVSRADLFSQTIHQTPGDALSSSFLTTRTTGDGRLTSESTRWRIGNINRLERLVIEFDGTHVSNVGAPDLRIYDLENTRVGTLTVAGIALRNDAPSNQSMGAIKFTLSSSGGGRGASVVSRN